ncbi:MAG: glycosyltransferase [Pseudomonadota bacterium]
MKISIVIPAHNEEKYIEKCLASIKLQQLPAGVSTEIVVVLNRCTDKTEQIAREYGAKIVHEDIKNISTIRNAGVEHASGEWVVTIDADSWMSSGVLSQIAKLACTGLFIGGGVTIRPERYSPGIVASYGVLLIPAAMMGLSFGLYWFRKEDFLALGGFDTCKHIAEDVDFQCRLKKLGKREGKKLKIITNEYITTSCRKFDQFGDWHFLTNFSNPCKVLQAINGANRELLDKHWYEVDR